MIALDPSEYRKVLPLIASRNDVTVLSALENTIENEVIVDDAASPTCVLVKTPGTNHVAGDASNAEFVEALPSVLDFWDQLTPDDDRWMGIVSRCHPNRFIRQYTRCHYELSIEDWRDARFSLSPGFVLEEVSLPELRLRNYENDNEILDWVADYRDDHNFMQNGIGNYVRTADVITNWSLSDGHYRDKVAIGVKSIEGFRRKGLSVAVVAATIRECFRRGFTTIEWLCVDFNKGSRAIAEKLGFCLVNVYSSFSSYPPCENLLDLSEQDWSEWANYYAGCSPREPKLLGEQLLAYIKANNDARARETLEAICSQRRAGNALELQWLASIPSIIDYLHTLGMCSDLSGKEWMDFLQDKAICE